MNILSSSRALVAAIALTLAGTAFAAPVTYELDPNHTQVIATWNHRGYSNPNAAFVISQGSLNWDAADPTKSSVSVDIPMDKLQSLVADFNEHLSSADFFEIAKFPTAHFASTAVKAADGEGHYIVTGTLTIKDLSKPVSLDVKLNGSGVSAQSGKPIIGFDATATIKRSDFGVGLYAPTVSDEVQLRITTEAYGPKPDATAASK